MTRPTGTSSRTRSATVVCRRTSPASTRRDPTCSAPAPAGKVTAAYGAPPPDGAGGSPRARPPGFFGAGCGGDLPATPAPAAERGLGEARPDTLGRPRARGALTA